MAMPTERCLVTGKLCWPNEREARDEMIRMRHDRATIGSKQARERRVIHCTECDGFHLTSWKKRFRTAGIF